MCGDLEMKEDDRYILCGICGSTMKVFAKRPESSFDPAYSVFRCDNCAIENSASEVRIAVNEKDEICPHCFSPKYYVSGIEENSSMCSNPSCSGFQILFDNEYKTLYVLWNKQICFVYSSKNGIYYWTQPIQPKLKEFYKRIVQHHKISRYFLGYRGLFSLSYLYWKRRQSYLKTQIENNEKHNHQIS